MSHEWKIRLSEPKSKEQLALAAEFERLSPYKLGDFCDRNNLRLRTKFNRSGALQVTAHREVENDRFELQETLSADSLPRFLRKDRLLEDGPEGIEFVSPARDGVWEFIDLEEERKRETRKIAWQNEIIELCRVRFANQPMFDGFITGYSWHYHAIDLVLKLVNTKYKKLRQASLEQIGKRYRLEETDLPPLNTSHPAFRLIRALVLVDHVPVFSGTTILNWNDDPYRTAIGCKSDRARDWVISLIQEELAKKVFFRSRAWTENVEDRMGRYPIASSYLKEVDQILDRDIPEHLAQRIKELEASIEDAIDAIRVSVKLPPIKRLPKSENGPYRT